MMGVCVCVGFGKRKYRVIITNKSRDMWLIPKGTELSNVAGTAVLSQNFTVRVRAYSEEDLWEVKGNVAEETGGESWKFGLDGNVLSLTVGAANVGCDVRANLTHHINDFVVTCELGSAVAFYVNGTSVETISSPEITGFESWSELVISGDGSPQTLLDRVTLDFGNVWESEDVTNKFDEETTEIPKSVKHTFRGRLDEFQVQAGSAVTYGNVEGRDTVVVIPAGTTLKRVVDLSEETMTVRVKATTNPWTLVGSNFVDAGTETDSWRFELTEGNVLSFAVNDGTGTGTMVESNVDLTDNVDFVVENQLLEYVVNVLGAGHAPDLFFEGHALTLDHSNNAPALPSNNAPALPSSNRLSLSSPSSSLPSHLDLLDLSYPLPLSSSLLSKLPSPSTFLPPEIVSSSSTDITPLAKDYAFVGDPTASGFAESETGTVITINNNEVYQTV